MLLRFDQRLKVGEVAGHVLRVLVAEPDPEAASLLQQPQLLNAGVDGIGSLALGLAELFAFRVERIEFLLQRATFLTQRTELSVQFADLNLCLSQCILQRVAFTFLRRQPCLNDGDLCAQRFYLFRGLIEGVGRLCPCYNRQARPQGDAAANQSGAEREDTNHRARAQCLRRLRPDIAAGMSSPIMARIVGAMSARMPPSGSRSRFPRPR